VKLAPLPGPALNALQLPIEPIEAGTTLVRIHWPGKALFFGPGEHRKARGRFDCTDGSFGTCYLAERTRAAFVETFLREGRVKLVSEEELRAREWSAVEVVETLRLVACHGAALTDLHTTSAISSGAYSRSRAWANALYHHPGAPDGLYYRSRHDDDEMCVALFSRAEAKVRLVDTRPLLDPATQVIEAINHYTVAVQPL
jgi:hypothetical protein